MRFTTCLAIAVSLSISHVFAATLVAERAGIVSPVDLSTLGTDDFAHWGLTDTSSFDHKAGANLIGTFTPIVGTGGLLRYDFEPTKYSWTGGTPTASATNTQTGVYIGSGGAGAGLQFSVPAKTSSQTLRLWVGIYNDTGRLDVSLSDGSAPAVSDTSFNTYYLASTEYVIQFAADSPGQTLSVKWTVVNGTGNATLQAATLSSLPPAPVARVACVGDSITAGAGASNTAATSYPAVLQSLLGPDYFVGNFGHSGATMLSAGDLPYAGTAEYTASASFNAGIVVLMLGSNDTKPQNWQYSGQFSPNTIAMINRYAGLPSHPQVYICTICPAIGAGNFGITEPVVEQVNPLIRDCAAKTSTPLIEVNAAMSAAPAADFPDNIHPNDAGYLILAQTVYDALRDPPVFTSGPAASASEVYVGQSVTFTAAASDPKNDPVTIAWDFGDSAQDTGTSVSHVFQSAGFFTVVATASDGTSIVQQSVTVTVHAAIAGTVSKGQIKFVFGVSGKDSLTLSGTLPLPAGLVLTGVPLDIQIADFTATGLNFDTKKTARLGKNIQMKVTAKTNKLSGSILASPVPKFSLALKNLSLFDQVKSAGFVDTDIKNNPVMLTAGFHIGGAPYQCVKNFKYSAKAEKSGSGR